VPVALTPYVHNPPPIPSPAPTPLYYVWYF
jgi:hypothetical protein